MHGSSRPLATCVAAAFGLLGAHAAAAPASGDARAAASECMYPGHVRGWSLLLDNRVLVDAGQRRFMIELQDSCPGLGHNPFLGFISDHPAGRICGGNGDRLVPHGSAASGHSPCDIQRIQAISIDDYSRYLEQRMVPVTLDQAP